MDEWQKNFTHLDKDDLPRMVDVSSKQVRERTAVAEARVRMGPELARLLQETGSTKKGPVIQTAVIAGIQGAKRTSNLIPMCHPLPLSAIEVDIQLKDELAHIRVSVKTANRTGVEMEALTGASVAALTLYDMCKSVTKAMVIESVRLLEKTGGKSGDFQAQTV
mgnify:CR=1 FL=1